MFVALAMILLVPLQGVAGVAAGLCMALGDPQETAQTHHQGSDHDHGLAHAHHSDATGADHHQENPAGSTHLGFGSADVEAFHRALSAQGVRFTRPPTPEHGITLAEFVDPEGARCSVSG